MATMYSDFKDQIEGTEEVSTRQAGLVLIDNGEGNDPILGITYVTDFRHEEEAGVGKLRELVTLTAGDHSFLRKEFVTMKEWEKSRGAIQPRILTHDDITQSDLIASGGDFVAIAAADRLFKPEREIAEAREYIKRHAPYNGPKTREGLEALTKEELLEIGDKVIAPVHSGLKKATIVSRILKSLNIAQASQSNAHSAWFHYGKILVLPRTDDVFGKVLDRLVEAAESGNLSAGDGSSAFSSGMVLFDERDLSDEKREEIKRGNEEYREDMEALAEAENAVKDRGGFYFLGNPRRDGDVTKYWLNGKVMTLPSGRQSQPFGWYTAQELIDEVYITEAEERDLENTRSEEKRAHKSAAL